MSPTSRKHARDEDLALLGRTIDDKYRVLDLLGKGNFGAVYLVELAQGLVGKKLALKVLPGEISHDAFYREQFINEIRLAMQLVNKYIVQIRDVGSTADGLLYYTMDYCRGQTLSEILDREGTLTIPHALRLARKVLWGLEAAHSLGILHRDIKPSNIMVVAGKGGRSVRILDLGVARDLRSRTPQRKKWSGTPPYMAPEQFRGEELTFAGDLYAVGAVLYESITAVKPYPGKSAEEIQRLFTTHEPRPPERFRPEVSEYPGLSELIMKSIALDPRRRFQHAREFIFAIQKVLKDVPGGKPATPEEADEAPAAATPPAGSPPVPHARQRSVERQSLLRTVAAATLLGVLLYGIIFRKEIRALFLGQLDREAAVTFALWSAMFTVIWALLAIFNNVVLYPVRKFFSILARTIREDVDNLRGDGKS